MEIMHILSEGSAHTCLHMHWCAHIYVCQERVGRAAVARRQRFFLFPLFVWGLEKSLGCKAGDGILSDL